MFVCSSFFCLLSDMAVASPLLLDTLMTKCHHAEVEPVKSVQRWADVVRSDERHVLALPDEESVSFCCN